MIRSQYDKVNDHIRKQIVKIKELVEGHSNQAELDKVIEDQFFDDVDFENHKFINRPNKKNLKHLEIKGRAVFILKRSGQFSYDELSIVFKENPKKIERMYRNVEKIAYKK